jgi:hypothetical protein
MNDMAEATLARVSLLTLFRRVSEEPLFKKRLKTTRHRRIVDREQFVEICSGWLEMDTREAASDTEIRIDVGDHRSLGLGSLASWLGAWEGPKGWETRDGTTRKALKLWPGTRGRRVARANDLLAFEEPHKPEERLVMSINLCLAGARYFERGGYPEDAAREFLKVVEIVTHYLWWGRAVDALPGIIAEAEKEAPGGPRIPELRISHVFDGAQAPLFWSYLIDLAVDTLDRASRLFRQSRRDEKAAEDTSRATEGVWISS